MTTDRNEDLLWLPGSEAADSSLARFQSRVEEQRAEAFPDYAALWQWSIDEPGEFWTSLWKFFGLDDLFGAPGPAIGRVDMPHASWFPEAHVNCAEYVLAQGADADIAIVGTSESLSSTSGFARSELSRGQLRRQVANLGAALRSRGVRAGDTVVGYLPNIPEAVVALLATASIGAVWSSVGQDYAAQAVVDRFGQLNAKVLITADGYRWAGREHSRASEIAQIQAALTTVEHTIVVARLESSVPEGLLDWREMVEGDSVAYFASVPFEHPLWVLFSSGTTGLPKGIVHGHGGVLLEQLKFTGLHNDVTGRDRFFWFASPSWVMWNILASALATGASIVTYDGAPTSPDTAALWRLVAETRTTYFGMSPGYLDVSKKAGLTPAETFDLSSLRVLGSSGSPLSPDTHRWVIEATGGLPLLSVSGGTDVASGFCAGAPTEPIYAGEIPVRCLGVALEAWDDDGHAVWDEVGEMVITRPTPSMPLYFWGDIDGSRYHAAYFDVYPGIWRHGDWITVTRRGSVIVHGRSDSTLNRNGVRMGSADIYNAVEGHSEIIDSLVLGVEQTDGMYWMPLFIVLSEDGVLDEALHTRICDGIRLAASPRHVPDEIIVVPALPHTRTGKRLEVPLKRLFQGADPARVTQPTAVDNPEALAYFVELAARRCEGLVRN